MQHLSGGRAGNRVSEDVEGNAHDAAEQPREYPPDKRYLEIEDLSSEWMWETDADLRFTYLSPNFARLTGLTVDEIVGKTRLELDVYNVEKRAQRHVKDLLARRDFRDYTYHMKTPDGRLLHMRTSGKAIFDDDNRFVGYRGVAADITDRIAAENRAEQAEVSLLEAIQKAPTALALYDRHDQLVAFNDHYTFDILGNAASLIRRGITFRELARKVAETGMIKGVPENLEAWLNDRVEQHRNPREPVNFHLFDGRWVQCIEFRLDSGAVLSTFTDITILKQREEELQAAKDAAEMADRIKTEFLANVSHELRTPLNAILGFSQIMQDELYGPLGDDRYRNYAHDIQDSGAHLLAVINDILDLSKIEAGKAELTEEVFLPENEVDACVRLVRERVDEAGLTLMCRVEDDVSPIYADKRKFRQIVINLLSNAVKFSMTGGHIDILARHDETGGLELRVRDNGTGMNPEDIPIALAPFRQVDGSLTRSHEGTGLGLPLCKSLCQLHGGTLTLESRKGIGTTAVVRFPAERTIAEGDPKIAATQSD